MIAIWLWWGDISWWLWFEFLWWFVVLSIFSCVYWLSFFFFFLVQFFCVSLPPLLNIFCFFQVHTISVLYRAHLCMKYSLGISNFLEEISSLSHSVLFLYFFALIIEDGFLISPCYSLEFYIQIGISLLSSFAFCFSYFHSYLWGFLRQPFCLFAFLFHGDGLDPCLLTSWEMLGWKKHKLESRLLGEISVTSDMQMTPPLWQKVKNN